MGVVRVTTPGSNREVQRGIHVLEAASSCATAKDPGFWRAGKRDYTAKHRGESESKSRIVTGNGVIVVNPHSQPPSPKFRETKFVDNSAPIFPYNHFWTNSKRIDHQHPIATFKILVEWLYFGTIDLLFDIASWVNLCWVRGVRADPARSGGPHFSPSCFLVTTSLFLSRTSRRHPLSHHIARFSSRIANPENPKSLQTQYRWSTSPPLPFVDGCASFVFLIRSGASFKRTLFIIFFSSTPAYSSIPSLI